MAEIKIVKRIENSVIVAVTGAKGALKYEPLDDNSHYDDMLYPGVLTLNGKPIVQMQSNISPTTEGLLATGYGIDLADRGELLRVSGRINADFAGLEETVQIITPILGLLEDGVYLIRDMKVFPTDGEGRFFWAVPDEMTRYRAFCDGFYCSEVMDIADITGEFIYPTQPPQKYDEERVQHYIKRFSCTKNPPRAIAFNALKGMSALLDGHHKACAAARLHRELDCIVITKGSVSGRIGCPEISFGYYIDKKYNLPLNENCGLSKVLFEKYMVKLRAAFKHKYVKPKIYSGPEPHSHFKPRKWERCYTDSVNYYPDVESYAAERVCDLGILKDKSAEEIYSYIEESRIFYKDNDYRAKTVLNKLLREGDGRCREVAFRLAKIEINPYNKPVIAAALKVLMHFKDDETEQLFVDMAVCDEADLADIAKDYWPDAN